MAANIFVVWKYRWATTYLPHWDLKKKFERNIRGFVFVEKGVCRVKFLQNFHHVKMKHWTHILRVEWGGTTYQGLNDSSQGVIFAIFQSLLTFLIFSGVGSKFYYYRNPGKHNGKAVGNCVVSVVYIKLCNTYIGVIFAIGNQWYRASKFELTQTATRSILPPCPQSTAKKRTRPKKQLPIRKGPHLCFSYVTKNSNPKKKLLFS